MRSAYQLTLASVLGIFLTACGGGGSSSGGTANTSTTANVSSTASLAASSALSTSSSSSTSMPGSASSSATTSAAAINLTPPPSVDAGKDQTATSGTQVSLAATAVGLDTASITWSWSQLSGPELTIANASSPTASFIAPAILSPARAIFKVTATDKNGKGYSDTLAIDLVAATDVKRYEAEADTGVSLTSVTKATSLSGYSGQGYVTGYNAESTDATTWTIDFANAGFYKIEVGYQVDSYKEFVFQMDSVQLTGKMPFIDKGFHSTSLGNQWISAGSHSFTVKGGWSYYNLDYLQFTPMAAPQIPQAVDATPADSNADANTKALYTYMISNYGKKTLSGQQDTTEMDTIFSRSGKLPAIFAVDLSAYDGLSTSISGTPTNQTENFIAKLNTNKQIGSLIWHWHSPTDAKNIQNPCPNSNKSEPDNNCWWNSFYTSHTNFNLTTALADTNSSQYKALIADIDLIAVQLKKVQAAGIPVLWRPLHEADGGWFWWGAYGADSFKKLWRIMHDRLTNYHQLHNLIWVLTNADSSWYPGDDVVDFVGIDAYPSDKHDSLNSSWSSMLERYDGHKMVVLSEFGGVPFINEMQDKGIWWGYFASWNDSDTNNPLGPKKMTVDEVNTIYNLPGVISADELTIGN